MTRDHERLTELLLLLMVAIVLIFARPGLEPEAPGRISASPAAWLIVHVPQVLQSNGFKLPDVRRHC